MSGHATELAPLDVARLRFLASVDRLLKAAEDAKGDRKRLFELIESRP